MAGARDRKGAVKCHALSGLSSRIQFLMLKNRVGSFSAVAFTPRQDVTPRLFGMTGARRASRTTAPARPNLLSSTSPARHARSPRGALWTSYPPRSDRWKLVTTIYKNKSGLIVHHGLCLTCTYYLIIN